MANVKVRVGQQPAVKVLTSGTISAVPSLGSLTDVSISDIQDGQVIAYESSSGLWKNTSQLNINIDGGVY
jgi:hypothetical protein